MLPVLRQVKQTSLHVQTISTNQRPIEVSRSIAAARALETVTADCLFKDPYAAVLAGQAATAAAPAAQQVSNHASALCACSYAHKHSLVYGPYAAHPMSCQYTKT